MVLIEDVDEEEEREALKAAAKAASQQWRRIQVVQEDSDDDAPVAPAASEQSVQHSGVSDPCPDLSILCSRAGAEEAKRHGNRLFGEGKVAECERWFSKALWLYESGRVRDFPGDLRCALHSNRALARLKLQRFRDAEEDCSAALEDNPQNAKARYRRAMARLELGKLVPGLEDVERALKELPEDSRQEAQDLKVRIQEQLATPEGPAGTAKQPTPKGREKKEPTKAEDSGYKRIHVKEVDEDKKEASKPETTAEKTHVNGHAQQEPYPDIQLEPTMQGAEKAKQRANELFQKGSLEESARWFSKAIWLLESGKVPGATASLRSVLHSNRAFARSKLQQWTGVEEDCTEALALNESNAKALYRRSQARLELNKLDAALEDVQQLLPLLAAPADQEAQDLKKRILEQQAKAKKTSEKVKEASVKAEQRDDAKAPPPAGFKRMEIVEASDSEEEEETKAATKVEAPKATPTSEKAPPPAGFKRMEIVEASDSEEEETKAAAKVEAPKAVLTSSQDQKDKEMFPELKFEFSRKGVEAAKNTGGQLFSKQDLQGASRHFSKALWMLQSGKVADAQSDASWCNATRLALHSNRAFSELRQENWKAAEDDCTEALKIDPKAVKALYRRAMAREKMGRAAEALKDADEALKLQPGAEELVTLQKRLKAAETPAPQPKSPEDQSQKTAPPPAGFKRMEIVEASDSDEEEPAKTAPAKVEAAKATPTSEKATKDQEIPELTFEFSRKGVEAAKSAGSQLFSKQDLQGASRHFSKALWMLQSGKVADASDVSWCNSTRLALHLNRAFSELRQENWQAAEDDCTEALKIEPQAVKALYRRAMAREKMGRAAEALKDVEEALKLQPGAEELLALQKKLKDVPRVQTPPGFKRMEIVEASDDEDEQETALPSPSPKGKAIPAEPPAPKSQNGQVQTSAAPDPEMFPDLKFEFSRKGVEAAKSAGSQLFSKQDLQGASRHFSKALWMLQSGKVADASDASWCNSTRLALHSNRAFSELRQENWRAAEDDCTEALKIDPQAVKALYRRAMAREKMGRAAEALKDVDEALKLQPGAEELVALQKRLKPAPKAETGFKRMEIVEASDDDEEAQEPSTQATSASTSPKAQEAGPPADSEPCEPWDELEPTLAGVEKGKEMGNRLFSEGKIEECERWFSKAIWLAEESGKVNVPSDLRGILHSNRAFARLRLQQWLLAEEDCTQALVLNASNSKALYRRAQARLELGKRSMALEDVDKLLPMLAPPSDRDAQELRERILALPESPAKKAEMFPDLHFEFSRKGVEAAKDAGSQLFSKQDLQGASRHFSKALWMLESGKVADAESDASWCNSTRLALHSNRAFSELRQGNWQAAEEDCTEALKINPQAVKALYRRAIAREELGRKEEALKDAEAALALQPGEELVALQKRLKAATETPGVEAVKRTETEAKAPSASPTPKEAPEPEPFDDIKLEPTLAGVEKGKEMGNKLFSAGKFEECERCFSKALWLAQESGKVKAPNDIRGILHSNRAFARLRLQRWSDAEKDCDEALRLNERNAKALYRRAMARQQLEKPKAALADLEQLLPMLDGNSNKDALALKEELVAQLRPSSPKALQKEAAKPAEAQRPASAPVRTVSAAPSMPSTSPKSGMELLRQFKSLKKHPEVLTKYVTEKVPPSLLQSLFSRSPIEADDLALVLQTLRTAASAAEPLPGPRVGEYLQQLLRTHGAGTQFSMLSSSEKQLVRELVAMVPGSSGDDLKQSFTKVL